MFKLLRTEAFRFVVVRVNHGDLARRLADNLAARFPARPVLHYDAQSLNFAEFLAAYEAQGSGFVWLENFGELLRVERDSQGQATEEMALHNAQRSDFLAGLNLRRDRLARYPIALLVLLWATSDELYLRPLMEQLPDLWSFRSLVVDLVMEQPDPMDLGLGPDKPQTTGLTSAHRQTKSAELARLTAALAETPPSETAYLATLYPQIVDLQVELGLYPAALLILASWEKLSEGRAEEMAKISLWQGDIYLVQGDLAGAERFYQKALALLEVSPHSHLSGMYDKYNLATSYQKMGKVRAEQGDLARAEEFYQKALVLNEALHLDYPALIEFKDGLALSYLLLGEVEQKQAKVLEAKAHYRKSLALYRAISYDFPENVYSGLRLISMELKLRQLDEGRN